MRRNTLHIIISIITIISLFITAATCSFCGRQLGTASEETKVDVEEAADETESEDTHKETAQDTDTAQSDNEDTEKKAPTISLAISEGPTYSEADDVCWYRVKATVTGNPAPTITWSQDFSSSSFGKKIAQVNLTRDNPNYTLTATATNSEGSTTDSIDLSWGCDGEEDVESIPEAESIVEDTTLNADALLSGYIIDGEGIVYTICASGDFNTNKQVKGYLSFDISELGGINVFDAELNIEHIIIEGNPAAISSSLNIKAYDYEDSLDFGDFAVGGTSIHTFDITTVGMGDSLVINNNDALINTLQDAINDGRHWYQLKFGLAGTVSNNDYADLIGFDYTFVTLTINYSK